MDAPCPAFVIVDTFKSTLASVVSPKSHWQLCGSSIIEHTLSWLDRSNIDRTYIWCCSQESFKNVAPLVNRGKYSFHTELIEPEKVMDIDEEGEDGGERSKVFASLGDCLRYADSSDLLTKYAAQAANEGNQKSASSGRQALPDFLLIGADSFGQQPLSSSVKRHRQWKEKDRSCVLTIVCSANSVQPIESGLCLVTDANGHLIHWRDSSGETQDLTLPPSLVAPKSQYSGELHVWPRVYPVAAVCSPEILVQFADNFDYEQFTDLIRGLLVNEEVLGQRIYVDVMDSGLKPKDTPQSTVFFVTDLTTFAHTTRSLLLSATLSRSPFSLSHLKSPAYYHRFPAAFVSAEASTRLSVIDGVSFISEKVNFSAQSPPSSVSSTFIGPSCQIGAGCRLEESYLSENCRIEDEVTVVCSFLGHNVHVKCGAVIERGCIVAGNVVIGARARIPAKTVLFSATPESLAISAELLRGTPLKHYAPPADVIGVGASECYAISITDLPRSVQQFLVWPGFLRHIKPKPISVQSSRSRTVSGGEQLSLKSSGDLDGVGESLDSMRHMSLDSEHVVKRREIELDEAIERTMRENLSADNAVLEVNSIKHAYGVGIRELTTSLFRAILTVPLRGATPVTNANLLLQVNQVLSNEHILPLAQHYIKSHEAKVDCLAAVETVSLVSTPFLVNLSGLLQQLYSNYDLLDDESVKQWFQLLPPQSPVRKYAEPFVKWLESAEEEEEDDD